MSSIFAVKGGKGFPWNEPRSVKALASHDSEICSFLLDNFHENTHESERKLKFANKLLCFCLQSCCSKMIVKSGAPRSGTKFGPRPSIFIEVYLTMLHNK